MLPMVRFVGSRMVIVRLNEAARTAMPRQTKLKQLMPKLELLCYQQKRPKVDEELDRLWDIYFESRIEESQDKFSELSEELNKFLDGEKVPDDKEKQAGVKKVVQKLVAFLEEFDFGKEEIEAVFRFKAYADVLGVYLKEFQDAR